MSTFGNRLIDSHCHVHFNAYKTDMDEVIRRTLDLGVQMITVGTQKDTSRRGLKVAEQYEGVWATVGLHPNHLVEQSFWDDDELPLEAQATPQIHTRSETFDYEYFKSLAKHRKCIGIGETGLDVYRIPADVDRKEVVNKQVDTFREHARLATEMNLPIVIHCRDAYPLQAALVKELIADGMLPQRGVVHCFSGTYEEACAFVDLGFSISFSGMITFPKRQTEEGIDGLSTLQFAARELPLGRILVETDSPYLTPIPHRGKRNEPWHVQFVAEKIAELKNMSIDEVREATLENTKRVFHLK